MTPINVDGWHSICRRAISVSRHTHLRFFSLLRVETRNWKGRCQCQCEENQLTHSHCCYCQTLQAANVAHKTIQWKFLKHAWNKLNYSTQSEVWWKDIDWIILVLNTVQEMSLISMKKIMKLFACLTHLSFLPEWAALSTPARSLCDLPFFLSRKCFHFW